MDEHFVDADLLSDSACMLASCASKDYQYLGFACAVKLANTSRHHFVAHFYEPQGNVLHGLLILHLLVDCLCQPIKFCSGQDGVDWFLPAATEHLWEIV